MNRKVKEFFFYNRSELKGILMLVVLILLVILARLWVRSNQVSVEYSKERLTTLQQELDSLHQAELARKKKKREQQWSNTPEKLDSLQPFDPNQYSLADWQDIGLSEKQAQTVLNYKTSIDGFKSKRQFRKLFVISDKLHAQLAPLIMLPDTVERKAYARKKWEKKEYKKRVYTKIDINRADTAQFKSLYGIGKVLAKRIVEHREKLGGFVSKEQLKEVWGLPKETLVNIDTLLLLESTETRKLNINKATKEELKAHPYLYWKHANAIVNYRKQHGTYKALDEIKEIVLIDDSLFQKVKPYLKL